LSGLFDFFQSASNAVADNVAGPVDLINSGLGLFGLRSKEPVLGSEWMKRWGLKRDVEMGGARIAGETAGLLSPALLAAKAPQIAKGLLQAQENAAIPRQFNPEMGAIVYHGSPHKFDKFDSSKIGTGEGAQAYGHGMYFAQAPEVANSYTKELAQIEMFHNGKSVGVFDEAATANAAHNIRAAGGDIEKAVKRAKMLYTGKFADDVAAEIRRLGPGEVTEKASGNLYKVDLPDEAIAKMLDWDRPLSQQAPEVQKAVEGALPGLKQHTWVKGNTPITDPEIIARIEQMLLKRPAEVEAQGFRKATLWNEMTGKDVHYALGGQAMHSAGNGEKTLRQAGIPGIRYLDGGSRATTGGEVLGTFQKDGKWFSKIRVANRGGVGFQDPTTMITTSMPFKSEAEALSWAKSKVNHQGTSNYVVFPGEEHLLKILERNGGLMGP
jgi:hypothetical protein